MAPDTQPNQAEPLRTCPVCGQAKPVSAFYVVKARHYVGGKRVKSVCKACDKAGARERMRDHRARQPKPPPKPRGRPVPPAPTGMLRGAEVATRLSISRQRIHVLAQQGRLELVQQARVLHAGQANAATCRSRRSRAATSSGGAAASLA